MKKLALGIIAVMALGSCNTTIGLGRDLRQLGTGLENKAHGRDFNGQEPADDEHLPTY